MNEAIRQSRPPLRWQTELALLLILAGCVYGVGIGRWGLFNSEGHRVAPAWAMIDAGPSVVPYLFDHPYLRKPPGAFWAIAGTSAVFGQHEWAARAASGLSALASALVIWLFASAWFGRPWGLGSAVAFVLTPWYWDVARQAEIEAIHNLGVIAAILGVVEGARPNRSNAWFGPVAAGGGLVWIVLTKGPAGLPAVGGTLAAVLWLTGTWRTLVPGLLGLAVGVCTLGLGLAAAWPAVAAVQQKAVTQPDVGGFFWSTEHLLRTALLLPAAWLRTLPWSLFIGLPFLDIPRSGNTKLGLGDAHAIARCLSLSFVFAVVGYMVLGIHNERYLQPAGVMVPVLAGYAWFRWQASEGGQYRWLLHRLILGRAWAWPAVTMAVFVVGWLLLLEPKRGQTSGREVAAESLQDLPAGLEILADDVIEARPELCLYAERNAKADGRALDVRWYPQLRIDRPSPTPGQALLLSQPRETAAYADELASGRLQILARGRVYKTDFVLVVPADDVPLVRLAREPNVPR